MSDTIKLDINTTTSCVNTLTILISELTKVKQQILERERTKQKYRHHKEFTIILDNPQGNISHGAISL